MALTFGQRIQALTNYDADNTSDNALTDTTTATYSALTGQWLNDGYREVINLLPRNLLEVCLSKFEFTSNPAGLESHSLTSAGKLYNIQIHNGTRSVECRPISSRNKGRAEDSGDMLYATTADPVYYIEGNYINVLPSGVAAEYFAVDYSGMTELAYSNTAISNFPDEAENLVIMYAAIKALAYLIANEEDIELYVPVIQNLKQDYGIQIQALKTGGIKPPQQKGA